MNIDYYAVLPSGPNGTLQSHCLTKGSWYHQLDEEWERAVHYGAGLIRIQQRGVELRIPIEFGFGYVLQYFRQFFEAEQNEPPIRNRLQAQLDWIADGLPVRLQRDGERIRIQADRIYEVARGPFLEALKRTKAVLCG